MFIMEKIIKRYGNSSVVVLTKEDMEILNKKVGDNIVIDVSKNKANK